MRMAKEVRCEQEHVMFPESDGRVSQVVSSWERLSGPGSKAAQLGSISPSFYETGL